MSQTMPDCAPPAGPAGSPMLEVRGLRITARRDSGVATIVSSVDLAVAPGETIGIVGESGSGKSMTARAMVGLLPPSVAVSGGQVRYGGRDLLAGSERQWQTVRGSELALVMQDPFTMLNPVVKCGRHIKESLVRADDRAGRRQRRSESIRRLAEVGISDATVADRYPFQLSGGMRQRVAIAAALARDPRLLIADEPTTALDVTTQREILTLLKTLQTKRGMGLVLVTHDLRVAFAMCDRIYVMYAGRLVEAAAAAEIETAPMHPYTHGLLGSEPQLHRRVAELLAIPGSVPAADDVSDCCPFEPRCRWAIDACHRGSPPLTEVAPHRLSACIRVHDISHAMADGRGRGKTVDHSAGDAPVTGHPLVEVRTVDKVFSASRGPVSAVTGVSLSVGEGESVGLVGESGSGKTTLARMLVGLERPTQGELVVDGIVATDWSKLTRQDRKQLHGSVQMVFQDPYSTLNSMRSVGWTLREAIRLHDPSVRNVTGRIGELLESVGLTPEHARRKPVALSGGERQRIAIARALAVRPKLIVCDEPLSALDMSAQAQVLNLLRRLHLDHGIGFLFISHDLAVIRQIADRVYVLFHGEVVESGPVDQILRQPTHPYTEKLIESVPRSESGWLQPVEDH